MYAALWRVIPGHWVIKLVVMLALIAGLAYALIFHAYPWVQDTFFPTPEVTVE